MKRLVYTDGMVTLIQVGKDNFTVTYGLQVKKKLNYWQAATEYGQCIMHMLANRGKLDNRMKGEK